jgi:hypothetical protein
LSYNISINANAKQQQRKSQMANQEEIQKLKEKLAELKSTIKVNQITISRVVKGRAGDTFISMNANYGSKEDSENLEGLSLTDAKLASYLLGMQVNVIAHEQACASGIITSSQLDNAKQHLKSNFNKLMTGE